jgi:hypothetical protein
VSLKNANLDLQRAQADVIRAEKLSTVGRLASGVAHEIGNPLGIVLGYLELLNRSDTGDAERRDYIKRSVVEIERIGAIIQQLLDFSRPAKGVPTLVSAHTVMAEVVEMLSVQPIFAGIDFHLQLSAGCDSVCADRDQIKQVLINLALNAADAVTAKGCGRQGRIVMSSELTPSNAGAVSSAADREEPRFFSIRCADNGAGIPEDQLSCVFDPFFTTKEPQRGAGVWKPKARPVREQPCPCTCRCTSTTVRWPGKHVGQRLFLAHRMENRHASYHCRLSDGRFAKHPGGRRRSQHASHAFPAFGEIRLSGNVCRQRKRCPRAAGTQKLRLYLLRCQDAGNGRDGFSAGFPR